MGKWGKKVSAGLVLALLLPASAQATLFSLNYTTFDESVPGGAPYHTPVTVAALLDLSADGYGDDGYFVDAISGTRGGDAITGLADPFSEVYLPTVQGYGFQSFVDSFGLTFTAGGRDYQVSRGPSDTTFYHETQLPADASGLSDGRLILAANFNLSPAPEPATWATMLAGFAIVGLALRRRALARA